jgi:hypothetical protein
MLEQWNNCEKTETQYSTIPAFQHSNGLLSELNTSYPVRSLLQKTVLLSLMLARSSFWAWAFWQPGKVSSFSAAVVFWGRIFQTLW